MDIEKNTFGKIQHPFRIKTLKKLEIEGNHFFIVVNPHHQRIFFPWFFRKSRGKG